MQERFTQVFGTQRGALASEQLSPGQLTSDRQRNLARLMQQRFVLDHALWQMPNDTRYLLGTVSDHRRRHYPLEALPHDPGQDRFIARIEGAYGELAGLLASERVQKQMQQPFSARATPDYVLDLLGAGSVHELSYQGPFAPRLIALPLTLWHLSPRQLEEHWRSLALARATA